MWITTNKIKRNTRKGKNERKINGLGVHAICARTKSTIAFLSSAYARLNDIQIVWQKFVSESLQPTLMELPTKSIINHVCMCIINITKDDFAIMPFSDRFYCDLSAPLANPFPFERIFLIIFIHSFASCLLCLAFKRT